MCDFSAGLVCPSCSYEATRLPTYRQCGTVVSAPQKTALPKPRPSPQPPAPASGPGTELKKLLKTWLRIEASPTCACTARARKMDEMEKLEPGWCAAHLDEIVGWLREEAAKRGLPFIGAAGKLLIKKAIRNALKNATQ